MVFTTIDSLTDDEYKAYVACVRRWRVVAEGGCRAVDWSMAVDWQRRRVV